MLKGIDVSNNDPQSSFATAKRAGIAFVHAKATEGTGFVDRCYEQHRQAARAAGLAFGAYHFAHPGESPTAQAAFFLDHAKPAPGDLVPVLDLEVTDKLPLSGVAAWALTWLDAVEKRIGVKPMLYTYPGFWSGSTFARSHLDDYPLWIADYGVKEPVTPAGAKWVEWQFADRASIAGVVGKVDENEARELVYIPKTKPTVKPKPVPRVDVVADGKTVNTRQKVTNPALLKRLGRLVRTAKKIVVRRSK